MGRIIVLSIVLATAHISEAKAQLWFLKVFDVASDAAKVTKKVASTVSRIPAVVRAGPPGTNRLFMSRTAEGNVLSVNAAGKEVMIAAAGVGGALALTDEGIALLRTADLIIPEAELPHLSDLLKKVSDSSATPSIRLVREDGTLGRVMVRKTNGQNILVSEKYAGVFLEPGSPHADELAWALQQPLRAEDVRVVSLLHNTDADMLRLIDDSIGDLHRPRGHVSPEAITRTIRDQKRKSIFVVGHVEGDSFAVRDASGTLQKQVRMADLEAAAKEADSTIFMLGCSAGLCSKSSGPLDTVNAVNIARGLKEAIRKDSMGEALSALSTHSGDTLIRPDIIDPIRLSVSAEQHNPVAIGAPAVGVVRISTLGRARSQELAGRLIPMIPTWLQFPYFAGLLVLVFRGRKIARARQAVRLPAPRFGYRPFTSIVVRTIRVVGYAVLMPFAAAISVGMTVAPWLMSLIGTLFISPVAAIISIFFGWRLWKIHRKATADEAWFHRFWTIAFFCSTVTLATELGITLLSQPEPANLESSASLQVLATSGLIALGLSILLFAVFRRLAWNPNVLLGWAIAAPILAIEFPANRLIARTGKGGT